MCLYTAKNEQNLAGGHGVFGVIRHFGDIDKYFTITLGELTMVIPRQICYNSLVKLDAIVKKLALTPNYTEKECAKCRTESAKHLLKVPLNKKQN